LTLSHFNPVQEITVSLPKIHFNVSNHAMHFSVLKWQLSFVVSQQNFAYVSDFFRTNNRNMTDFITSTIPVAQPKVRFSVPGASY
jgi:hypothetical protein